jgi:Flp pilus assembly pilin Flp
LRVVAEGRLNSFNRVEKPGAYYAWALAALSRRRRGPTAVEYGMICGRIFFMAVVGAIVTLGAQTGNMFENI